MTTTTYSTRILSTGEVLDKIEELAHLNAYIVEGSSSAATMSRAIRETLIDDGILPSRIREGVRECLKSIAAGFAPCRNDLAYIVLRFESERVAR